MKSTSFIDLKLGELIRHEIIKSHGAMAPAAVIEYTKCSKEMATTIYSLWLLETNKEELEGAA